ncbi:hypothetical protein SUGI_0025040 [Cryptomeria japonica]|nr:hypothetical protein SUGI_0025040 [Cryptomeria japonica]
MEEEKFYRNGYVIIRDPKTQRKQVMGSTPLPPKRGKIKKEIFKSMVGGMAAAASEFFSCMKSKSKAR